MARPEQGARGEWMHRQLGAVDERIMWEFGPSEGGHRLVLTPEVHRNLRPMVETMLERAPRLPGWSYAPYRPPEPFLTQYAFDEYLGEIAYVDDTLGKALGPILSANPNTLLIVTADHGEARGDHGENGRQEKTQLPCGGHR